MSFSTTGNDENSRSAINIPLLIDRSLLETSKSRGHEPSELFKSAIGSDLEGDESFLKTSVKDDEDERAHSFKLLEAPSVIHTLDANLGQPEGPSALLFVTALDESAIHHDDYNPAEISKFAQEAHRSGQNQVKTEEISEAIDNIYIVRDVAGHATNEQIALALSPIKQVQIGGVHNCESTEQAKDETPVEIDQSPQTKAISSKLVLAARKREESSPCSEFVCCM